MSRAATGEAKPPEIPTAHGEPANSPWPIAEVASTAPIASPSASSGSRASGEHRAAAGDDERAARRRRSGPATSRWPRGAGATAGAGAAGDGGGRLAGSACTSSGMLSSTGRRSTCARRNARAIVGRGARAGVHALGDRADGRRERRLVEPEVRPQRRGRRLAGHQQQRRAALAASVSPVIAFVKPGPWWTVQTPTRPLTRA